MLVSPARRFVVALVLVGLSSLTSGCTAPTDAADGGSDAPLLDVPPADVPVARDTAADSATPLDAPTDAAVADAPAPTGDTPSSADAGPTDAAGCAYAALDEVVVQCAGRYTFVSRFGVVPMSRSCPDYHSVGSDPDRYESADAAIVGEGCDGSCRWRFAMSVSRIYCGRRSGYERLTATGCADVYRFDDGYYPSVEAYDSTHPCP